jgi:hypothetical protein
MINNNEIDNSEKANRVIEHLNNVLKTIDDNQFKALDKLKLKTILLSLKENPRKITKLFEDIVVLLFTENKSSLLKKIAEKVDPQIGNSEYIQRNHLEIIKKIIAILFPGVSIENQPNPDNQYNKLQLIFQKIYENLSQISSKENPEYFSIKVFISYSIKDREIAKQLKQKLEKSKYIKAWAEIEDLPFGKERDEAIKKEIKSCDYLIVILSKNAIEESRVSREIGLVDEIYKIRNIDRPIILGLASGEQELSYQYKIKDFKTGEDKGEYDFGRTKKITLEDDLVTMLLPKLHFIENLDDDHQRELFEESISVYHTLFPIESERDPESNIEERIERYQLKDPKWRWKDHYVVLTLLTRVIGLGYFSSQLEVDKKWCFGNYFGILPAYRIKDRAKWFFNEIENKLKRDNPGLKGIIFEIEKPDLSFLKEANNLSQSEKDALKNKINNSESQDYREEFITNVRRLRRMNWFLDSLNTYMLLKREPSESLGYPFYYEQPGMEEPLEENVVKDLIPLVSLFDNSLKDETNLFQEIIEFLYNDVFSTEIFPDLDKNEFETHVQTIENEIKKGINDYCFLGKDIQLEISQEQRIRMTQINKLTRDLGRIANQWGISHEIKL